VLAAGLRSLAQVKAGVVSGGWTEGLARQALAAVRVAASVGLGRPVMQTAAVRHAASDEGQLALRRGILRRRHWMISAATGAPVLERELAQMGAGSSRNALAAIRAALVTFTPAAYGRNETLDAAALDAALAQATTAMRQMRLHSFLPMAGWAGLRTSAAGLPEPAMGEDRL
jgi:hypothetical protein